jgi:hypothetical protein
MPVVSLRKSAAGSNGFVGNVSGTTGALIAGLVRPSLLASKTTNPTPGEPCGRE